MEMCTMCLRHHHQLRQPVFIHQGLLPHRQLQLQKAQNTRFQCQVQQQVIGQQRRNGPVKHHIQHHQVEG